MRSKNSAMMIGRVKLKSNRAAFSNSSAREGGAKAREEAARRERDLRDRIWGFEICLRIGILGTEIWKEGSLGEGDMEDETRIRGFEEAMIMLAIVILKNEWLLIRDLDFNSVTVSRSLHSVSLSLSFRGLLKAVEDLGGGAIQNICHTNWRLCVTMDYFIFFFW